MKMAFNTSSSSNSSVVEEDKIQLVTPLLVCVVIIGFLSQILNGGVFILVIRQKTIRRNPYHFLVLMLSVSDYLIGLSNVCIGPGIIFPYLHKCGTLVVIQIFLLTNGLYLSLLQIFLISLQRYLVICKEKWNTFFFSKKRKYIVCISSWALVTATNLSLLSPPEREFRFSEERFVAFVYGGLYPAFTFYNRFLTLTFLSTTIILYLITLRHVLKNFGKVKPLPERSIQTQGGNPIQIHVIAFEKPDNRISHPSQNEAALRTNQNTCHSYFVKNRRRKVNETMFLVGLLILVLLVLTGPLIVAILMDHSSRFLRFSYCICTINSLVNPFIYLRKLGNVRNCLKSTFTCTIYTFKNR